MGAFSLGGNLFNSLILLLLVVDIRLFYLLVLAVDAGIVRYVE